MRSPLVILAILRNHRALIVPDLLATEVARIPNHIAGWLRREQDSLRDSTAGDALCDKSHPTRVTKSVIGLRCGILVTISGRDKAIPLTGITEDRETASVPHR